METENCIYKLETNIDDCSGEVMGYAMEQLLQAGARDVYYKPIFMKKNRPGYELTVICTEDKIKEMETIIFCETTTIGIRRMKMERTVLPREQVSISLEYGQVTGKRCTLPNGQVRCYPEYESIAAVARERGISIQQMLEAFYAETKKMEQNNSNEG